jgi:hypothetical protein
VDPPRRDTRGPDDTREIFERVSLGEDFPEFLTLIAYDKVD